MTNKHYDVIVIGGGNAGLCAAISAHEMGSKVLVIEKAPKKFRGGNSSLTMNFRFPHDNINELLNLIQSNDPNIDNLKSNYLKYSSDEMKTDLLKVSGNLAESNLVSELVTNCRKTILWLKKIGHNWEVKPNLLTGSLPIRIKGSGAEFQKKNFRIVESLDIEILYEEEMIDFDFSTQNLIMVTTKNNHLFYSKALILASGSYQSNPLMRKKYLGEAWEDIQLRGVVYNTGDAIKIAIEKSIKLFGDFNHCHSTPQCSNLSQLYPGDNDLSQSNSRYCFQLGITVNKMGMRFFNEHEDLPNFIYAKFGAAIIQQPEKIAFQIFDSESIKKLPHGYFSTKNFYRSQTIEGLAKAFNISSENILKSVYDYNLNLDINLNNWTHFTDINRPLPILKAPFYLAPVRAGLTYCYGGLKINSSSNIFTSDDLVIPNIFAVGELAGGLHYQNYAGGTGMMFGSHFGRIAGLNASKIK